MHYSKKLLIAALAAIAPALTQAATITSNPTLSVNGLNFDSFTCSLSKAGVLATPSSCGQINVNTITSPGSGIEISSLFSAGLNSFDDAALNYHVSSATGISNVGLDFNGTFLGLAVSSVTETVFSGGKQVGFASVSCASPALGGGCNQTDMISLNGTYNNLTIQKDIAVASSVVGYAQISEIDQTFSAAPEPSSMALLGSALIGTAALLRRKVKKDLRTV